MGQPSLHDPGLRRAGTSLLKVVDPALGVLVEAVGPLNSIPDWGRGFGALVAAIVGQQISVQAADAILARVADHLEAPLPSAGDHRARAPAPPSATAGAADRYGFEPHHFLASSPAGLREAGLSRAKASYILDLAARLADDRLDLAALASLGDEEAVDELMAVKGIGRWTAETYLLFSLGRPDVLPAGDLGIRIAVQHLYRLPAMPDEGAVRQRGTRWRPYSSLAALYLWRGRRVLLSASEPAAGTNAT